jgi:uncharacterized spore protein YtfJ
MKKATHKKLNKKLGKAQETLDKLHELITDVLETLADACEQEHNNDNEEPEVKAKKSKKK